MSFIDIEGLIERDASVSNVDIINAIYNNQVLIPILDPATGTNINAFEVDTAGSRSMPGGQELPSVPSAVTVYRGLAAEREQGPSGTQ
ncbi:MAG TPA: hypothetical protein DEG69_11460, partial [Flavobacteriaceae bacterium]|nr:hypothetical protein [Flavobacteriaceae bacterium]